MDMMEVRRRVMLSMANGKLPEGIKAIASGVATIDSVVSSFTITTNLGYAPDFFMIRIDIDDWDKIPFGTVVEESFVRNDYANIPSFPNGRYHFLYVNKHVTSGNLIAKQYQASVTIATENTFTVQRGGADWYPNDTDGNPLQYRWVAIKMNE